MHTAAHMCTSIQTGMCTCTAPAGTQCVEAHSSPTCCLRPLLPSHSPDRGIWVCPSLLTFLRAKVWEGERETWLPRASRPGDYLPQCRVAEAWLWGVGGGPRRELPRCRCRETLGSSRLGARTPGPAPGLLVSWPPGWLSPESLRYVETSGAPQGEDVGLSVGVVAREETQPWGTFFAGWRSLGWEGCFLLPRSPSPIPGLPQPLGGWQVCPLWPGSVHRTSCGVCAVPVGASFMGAHGKALRHPLT